MIEDYALFILKREQQVLAQQAQLENYDEGDSLCHLEACLESLGNAIDLVGRKTLGHETRYPFTEREEEWVRIK